MTGRKAVWGLVLASFAVAAVAILTWTAIVGAEPPPGPLDERQAEDRAATTQATDAAGATPAPGTVAPAAAPAAPGGRAPADPRFAASLDPCTLRVQLRGLHPAAPWTEPLRLDVEGRDVASGELLEHDASGTVDATGCARFSVPAWWRTASALRGRVTAHDESYLAVDHRWAGEPASEEVVVEVQVVAVLEGRVIDARGEGVAAVRVRAFAVRDGKPVDESPAENNTRQDGTFWLQVPPGVPLALLAVAMERATGAQLQSIGDGAVADNGSLRTDLLPTMTRVTARIGAVTSVPDLVLSDAATLQGVVQWNDGTPILLATVRTVPRAGITLRLGADASVRLDERGGLAPIDVATTDDLGQFALPSLPGVPIDVALDRLPEAHVLGGPLLCTATPPQTAVLRLPRPILLRVLTGGVAVAHALVECEGIAPIATSATGTVAVVALGNGVRVRGRRDSRLSEWVALGPDAAGTRIDLQLVDALCPVLVDFEGDFRVRNTVIEWRAADGRQGREHLLRDDRGGPFRLFLEPGNYRLRAGAGGGERNGVHLLPVEQDVVVTAGVPVRIVLPASFGGSFVVFATDSNGLYVAGRCAVRNAAGEDLSGPFRVEDEGEIREGASGELSSGGPNTFTGMLPPGDYELAFDFPDHGAVRRTVRIRPRETIDVRIRL